MGCGAEKKGDTGLLLPFLHFPKVRGADFLAPQEGKSMPSAWSRGAGLAQRPFQFIVLNVEFRGAAGSRSGRALGAL